MIKTAVLPIASRKLNNNQAPLIQIDDYLNSKKLFKKLKHLDVMEDYLKNVNLLNLKKKQFLNLIHLGIKKS